MPGVIFVTFSESLEKKGVGRNKPIRITVGNSEELQDS